MTRAFTTLAFSPSVRAAQSRLGSRERIEKLAAREPDRAALSDEMQERLRRANSVIIGAASLVGWPLIQHRGGPPGFIKVLAPDLLGFADYSGNRQYITVGNLAENDKMFLLLLDYTARTRLKIWGHGAAIDHDPALLEHVRDMRRADWARCSPATCCLVSATLPTRPCDEATRCRPFASQDGAWAQKDSRGRESFSAAPPSMPIGTEMAAGEMDQDQRMAFEARLVALRPALHHYAARMVGSALDGEDVVQEAIARAIAALDRAPPGANADGWLFRIAHNAAMDFLRARARGTTRMIEEDDLISGDDEAASRVATRAALSVFMQLPPSQRGVVILKDVLGYSNEESASILGITLAATKAALHRGRNRLRVLADAPTVAPQLDPTDLDRLRIYVDRFNARDFDAIRTMIADDVRFDLVAQAQGDRSSFETYFSRYGEMIAWHLAVGLIDGRLAAIVTDPADPAGTATHVITIDWAGGRISRLRDFYHARYVLDGAAITLLA